MAISDAAAATSVALIGSVASASVTRWMFAWKPSGATERTSLVIELERATASKPPLGSVSSFVARTELSASQAGASA